MSSFQFYFLDFLLKTLLIQNIVLIDKAEIDFSSCQKGLCILTGETGSGKSILLDAFGLAIGFRSNLRLIGSHENKASVTAEFDITNNPLCQAILEEHGLIDSENPASLRIRRLIQENSSSKAFVNDQVVGINLLAQIGETLVEIHGQHDQRGLLNPAFHETILDDFSKNDELLAKLKKIYDDLKHCDNKINDLAQKKEQAEREKDYLSYVVRELENANIKIDEEDELVAKKDQLTGKEKIINFLSELKSNLLEVNSQLIASQKITLRNQTIINNYLKDNKEEFEKLADEIDHQITALDQQIEVIEAIERNLYNRDDNLDDIEERLFLIRGLARKFNVKINDLPNIINDAQEKLSLLDKQSATADNLILEREKLYKKYQELASQLSEKRKKYALILAKKVEEELQFLKMENVKFLVDIKNIDTNNVDLPYGPTGFDKVRFFASINRNNFDEITKIASGGELSRFMLALKVALMDIKSVPVMIFDEIDTGVGGSTADAIGKRLKILSKNLQIFVVTHQPQIAAKADLHFKISKLQNKDKIKTVIQKLSLDEKDHEIARMISGEQITNEALAAAKILQKN